MSARWRVKTLMLVTGERLPVIVDSLGQPLFGSTIYSLTELRGRNRATNTIASALRSLLVLFLFLDLREIPLDSRLDSGQIFSLAEIEDLVRLCRLPMEQLNEKLDASTSKHTRIRVTSLEKHRSKLSASVEQQILPSSAANRLRYIRDYLVWIVHGHLSKSSVDVVYSSSLGSARDFLVQAINARLPVGNSQGLVNQREGLDPNVAAKMLAVVDPQSPENPWTDDHSRFRNSLAIQWLYYLGLRRGELLNIRISDLNFREGVVFVIRRADDPGDPRKYQPTVKTRERSIPLSLGLLDMTAHYITEQRAHVKGARKHDFLFVSSVTGAPLSISSLTKVFDVLRSKCPGLPQNLSAHVLRHTWNDCYSVVMDKNKVSEETEKKCRSYLMGWSETSGTAAIYTRRHIRKKAQDASLEMQEAMIGNGCVDD